MHVGFFSRVVLLALAAVSALAAAACATTPTYRTAIPFTERQLVEAGGGVHGGGGVEIHSPADINIVGGTAFGGASGFATFRVPQTDMMLFGAGSTTGTYGVVGDLGWGITAGGQGGLRLDYHFQKDMWIAGELYGDYQFNTWGGAPQHRIGAIATLIIAERLAGSFWLYARPTTGIGLLLDADGSTDFSDPLQVITQMSEAPVGLHVDLNRHLAVRVEGGIEPYRTGVVVGAALIGKY